MGIKGIMQLLKETMSEAKLSDFKGQTAAVDTSVWLFRGSYSCAYELAKGEPTLAYLSYPIKCLRLLITRGIKPICVFDGLHLDAKAAEDHKRELRRQENVAKGKEYDEKGDFDNA